MKRYLKITRWVLTAAVLVIAFVVLLAVVVPRLIDIEPIREAMTGSVSQKIGGEFRFQKIRLSILPRPNITLTKGNLVIPETFSTSWESLTVSPKLFPLITGNILISRILVVQPQIDVTVGQKDAKSENNLNRD
jgi:uncharacterized protein involved in outer membrane biogenesis